MDIYLNSSFSQIVSVLFVGIFLFLSYKKPRFTSLLFPLILPLYLIKIKLPLQFIEIPTNLLEILAAIFLIINWHLIWKGISSFISITHFTLPITLFCSILLLFLSSILSTFYTINVRTALGASKSWFWIPILLFFVLVPLLKSTRHRQKFLYSLAISGIVISLMGLPFVLQNLYTYDGRLAGIFLSPNHLAMALVPGIIALIVEWKMKNEEWKKNKINFPFSIFHFPFIIALIVELLLLYLSYSYGTWIALAIAVLVFLHVTRYTLHVTKKQKNSHLGLILLIIILIAGLSYSQKNNPKLQHIINGDYYSSFHSRQMIWQSALKISKDYWLTGVGTGNFQQAYLDYQKYFSEPYIEWAVPMPHNIFLAFLTQLGIVGLISFIVILALTLSVLIINPKSQILTRSNKAPSLKPQLEVGIRNFICNWDLRFGALKNQLSRLDGLSLWALAYLIYFIIHGLVDTPYFKNDLAIVFWLALVAIWSQEPKRETKKEGPPEAGSAETGK